MKLDKRFKVLPFCCFNAKKCGIYIGHKGYFSNDIDDFKYIDLCKYGTLEKIYSDQPDPFHAKEVFIDFKHFIPECFVEPKKKNYRPYTLMEFNDKFTVGQPIKFRPKGKVGREHYLILNGYMHEQREDQTITYIYIGSIPYTLNELFNAYEWQKHYTEDFEPFGVEVEE